MAYCLNCGEELIWNCDYDTEDVGSISLELDEPGISSIYSCPKCGMDYLIQTPLNEDIYDTTIAYVKVSLDREEDENIREHTEE